MQSAAQGRLCLLRFPSPHGRALHLVGHGGAAAAHHVGVGKAQRTPPAEPHREWNVAVHPHIVRRLGAAAAASAPADG